MLTIEEPLNLYKSTDSNFSQPSKAEFILVNAEVSKLDKSTDNKYFILGSLEALKEFSKDSKGEEKYISNFSPFLIIRGLV